MLLAPRHLSRLTATVDLFTRYGLADFAREQGLDRLNKGSGNGTLVETERTAETAAAFRKRLVELGPAYIKLGQLLSSRADLLPESYIVELNKLQDDVDPLPAETVREIIEDEIGAKISQLFDTFDDAPLGAASLGQVHAATMRDGRQVVVKVQRPDIRETLSDDIAFFRELAKFLGDHTETGRRLDLVGIIAQLEQVLADELDYRVEARNAQMLRRAVSDFPRIMVPRIVTAYSTERVLTMERLSGVKVTEIANVVRTEVDFAPLADDLVRAYVRQIAIDGHFHADPHPGNVHVMIRRGRDGLTRARIALIDCGMTARLTPQLRELAVRVLFGIADDRGDDVAEALAESGEKMEGFNRQRFTNEVAAIVTRSARLSANDLDAGLVLYEMLDSALKAGLRPPPELTMLAKTLAQLSVVTRTLEPAFKPRNAIRRSISEVASQQARSQLNPRNAWRVATDAAALVGALPRRLDIITKRFADNEFTTKIEVPQVHALLEGMQKVANRILTGLVLAGLLIASAMLLNQRPVLGTVGFVIAGSLALYIVATILISDEKKRRSVSSS